jgi:hypothetical protein
MVHERDSRKAIGQERKYPEATARRTTRSTMPTRLADDLMLTVGLTGR